MNSNNEKLKVQFSLALNLVIFVFTIFATIVMLTGFKFMDGEFALEVTKLGVFKFFTVDSNIFMGVISLIFAIKGIKLLKGKISEISKNYYILKLMATTGVTLTFIVVFGYLGLIVEGGLASLLKNSNLFFHLLIPVVSVLTFICFERNNKLNFKDTKWGIVPTALYGVFYLINALVHIQNGKVPPAYDWYWFVQGGLWQAFIVVPLIFAVTFLISYLLYRFNRIKNK